MASIFCSPPEKGARLLVPPFLEAWEVLENPLITPVDRRFVFAQISAHLKVFHDRHVGKDVLAFRHIGMPNLVAFSGVTLPMRLPANSISPPLIRFNPVMVRRVVLLPAPLAPIKVTISPSSTEIEMSLTAATLIGLARTRGRT